MTTISAFDISPNDSCLTQNINSFIDELFKADDKICLKETERVYNSEERSELADAIVSLHEKVKNSSAIKEEGGEK